jgi:hypothetical protein
MGAAVSVTLLGGTAAHAATSPAGHDDKTTGRGPVRPIDGQITFSGNAEDGMSCPVARTCRNECESGSPGNLSLDPKLPSSPCGIDVLDTQRRWEFRELADLSCRGLAVTSMVAEGES